MSSQVTIEKTAQVSTKKSIMSELIMTKQFNNGIFCLDFEWQGPPPKAGQFFMIKPERATVFLARPISAALYLASAKPEDIDPRKHRRRSPAEKKYFTSDTVRFLVLKQGKGTEDIVTMRAGEKAEISGPLGNTWHEFLPQKNAKKLVALIGGGVGVAPLNALASELERHSFDFYAGFKTCFRTEEERYGLLVSVVHTAANLVLATEEGSKQEWKRGRITDHFDPAAYSSVYACGPEAMLKVVAAKCKAAGTPCFISMEKHMACGAGACLGSPVKTIHGNRRCCADGPIFNAEEVIFE
jgi:NAD(P)H-flavin reductase